MVMKDGYGALILAGGQGKRMGGVKKADLAYGTDTFLSMIEETLSFLPLGYLSIGQQERTGETKWIPVADVFPGRGPMGGIYSVLQECACNALMVVPCDMPFFPVELAEYILKEHQGEPVLYFKTGDGKEFPLCGIYTKACLPAIEKLMKVGDFRMRQILKEAGGRIISVPKEYASSHYFLNVNTPEIYRQICEKMGGEEVTKGGVQNV
ncbi:MAG: molybdenum cofactor guanylyltransferase [Lachnospiraceae bacterium]